MLYFRSDTRSPSEIFARGFSPRALNPDNLFYAQAIGRWSLYSALNPKEHENEGAATDADCLGGVSLSINFNATAMFPTASMEGTYIYCIDLPEPTAISLKDFEGKTADEIAENMVEKGRAFEHVDDELYGSIASKGRVYDLEALQLQQVYSLLEEGGITSMQELLKAAWTLYGYEKITGEVRPENIVMAVECRNRRKIVQDDVGLEDNNYATSFDLGEIRENARYQPQGNDLRSEARARIMERKAEQDFSQQQLSSPGLGWGLGGKILPAFYEGKGGARAPRDRTRVEAGGGEAAPFVAAAGEMLPTFERERGARDPRVEAGGGEAAAPFVAAVEDPPAEVAIKGEASCSCWKALKRCFKK